MRSDKVKLALHCDLESEEVFDVGWSPKYLEENDKDRAKDLCCLEVRIDGLRNNNELYDDAVQALTEVAWQLSGRKMGKAYLVLVEDQLLPKSKLRSYKGLFPYKGQIKQGDFVEWEVELDRIWSFFMGMAPIIQANRDECFSLAKNIFRSFILLSTEQTVGVYGREFLESITPCLSTKGNIIINQMKLIPRVCKDGLMLFKFGLTDPRGEYVNIRLFFDRKVESLVQKAVAESLG